MKRVLLFLKDSPKVKELIKDIEEVLDTFGVESKKVVNKKNFARKLNIRNFDLIIVVGGDGTFLSAARLASRFGVPLVGVNVGRFGFLTEIRKEEVKEVLPSILGGEGKLRERMMIDVYLRRKNKLLYLGNYLNDAVVSKTNISRIINLKVFANDEEIVEVFGDGVILATPTGSTAYALSAGGPIVYPYSESFIFVPICPHTLSNRPLVLPPEFTVKFQVLTKNEEAYLTLDGQVGKLLKNNDEVIVKKSKYKCLVYEHPKLSFFQILRSKLRWG